MKLVPDPALFRQQAAAFVSVYERPGRYMNDHCIVRHNGIFHLFYIDGEVGKGCYSPGNEVTIGHATSADLYHWVEREPALTADPAIGWEEAHIFAPYVLQHNGMFYMFYTGDTRGGGQSIGLATSQDLFRWERHPYNPVFRPSLSWARWHPKERTSGRDPHVIWHKDYGFILYFVADMKDAPERSAIGCALSENLVTWQDGGPVLIRHHSDLESLTCKAESPFVLERGGLWYLFYRHGNGTKYAVSDSPVDWIGRDTFYFGPCHASEIFEVDGQWYVTSCSRPPEDIGHRYDRSRGLYIARMHWDDWRPRISVRTGIGGRGEAMEACPDRGSTGRVPGQ